MMKLVFPILLLAIALTASARQLSSGPIDSTFSIFWNKNIKVRIQIFNSDEMDEERMNALLSVFTEEDGRQRTLYRDSIYAYTIRLALRDIDGDGVKDLLVLNAMRGATNPNYHAYLIDQKGSRLTKVKGFERVFTPVYDWGHCALMGWEIYERKLILRHFLISKEGRLFLTEGVLK